MIGIYMVVCRPTGRFYIGSSYNILLRKKQHLTLLERGKHHNIILQRVFNKYGAASLYWKRIIVDDIEDALALEQHYLYEHLHNPKCMNIGVHASGGDNLSRNPRKSEIVAKMSKTLRKRMASMSCEERKVKYGLKGVSNGMFGKTHSKETSAKIGRKNKAHWQANPHPFKGTKASAEARAKIKAGVLKYVASPEYKNGFKGKSHSEEQKRIWSEAAKGRKPGNMRKVRIGKRRYESVRAASKALDVTAGTICYRIRSPHFSDYSYIN